MRPGDDGEGAEYTPDWSSWAQVERTKAQDDGLGAKTTAFDPVIVGPWMDLWDIEAHEHGDSNPHVDRYMTTDAAKRPGGEGYLPDKW